MSKIDWAAVKATICDRVAGGETLRAVCRDKSSGAPSFQAVYKWIEKDAEFRDALEKARKAGADALADECLAIAEGSQKKGDELRVPRDKLRVWTRLQLLAKWHPQRYGERTELHHTAGGDLAAAIIAGRKRAGQ